MNELFPVICGTAVGLCCASVQGTRARTALWLALSLVSGSAATFLSGEYKLGPQYLAFDAALAAAAALGAKKLAAVVHMVGRAIARG